MLRSSNRLLLALVERVASSCVSKGFRRTASRQSRDRLEQTLARRVPVRAPVETPPPSSRSGKRRNPDRPLTQNRGSVHGRFSCASRHPKIFTTVDVGAIGQLVFLEPKADCHDCAAGCICAVRPLSGVQAHLNCADVFADFSAVVASVAARLESDGRHPPRRFTLFRPRHARFYNRDSEGEIVRALIRERGDVAP